MVESAEECNDRGREAFLSSDFDSAYRHYGAAIRISEGRVAKYLVNRAACGLKLGRWELASADAAAGLELEPLNSKVCRD